VLYQGRTLFLQTRAELVRYYELAARGAQELLAPLGLPPSLQGAAVQAAVLLATSLPLALGAGLLVWPVFAM
jgi:hypothetical protein